MSTMKPRVTLFAPQFLVDNLERSIADYQEIGSTQFFNQGVTVCANPGSVAWRSSARNR